MSDRGGRRSGEAQDDSASSPALEQKRGARLGGREVASWLLVIALLAAIFGPGLVAHMQSSADPLYFNGDVRQQIYPFYRFQGGDDLHPDDYFADYFLANLPLGFIGLYGGLARVGVDPAALSKVVPYVLLFMTLAGLGAAAYRVGGKPAVWLALGLALGSDLFLSRMVGGLPRAFGLPFVACILAALCWNRVRAASVLVVTAALFYPVASAIGGLTLAVWLLLFPPGGQKAPEWPLRRRMIWLLVTAGLAALTLLPTALAGSRYGAPITPAMYDEYPEAGPGGRYQIPYLLRYFSNHLGQTWGKTFFGTGDPLWPAAREVLSDPGPGRAQPVGNLLDWVLVLSLAGWVGLARREAPGSKAITSLAIAALLGHTLARGVLPYLYIPARYASNTLPILMVLFVSAAPCGWLRKAGRRRTTAQVIWAIVLGALVFGHPNPRLGLSSAHDRAELATAFAALPPGSLVAGLPMSPAINDAPYLARRSVLLSSELHQAFHPDFLDEMRRRVVAIADAHYATDIRPLLVLREEFGVTHFYADPVTLKQPPKYLRPFETLFEERWQAGRKKGFVFEKLRRRGIATSRAGHWFVDLSMLGARAAPSPDS